MSKDQFNFFLPFAKVEKNDDGSRTVRGYASTPTLDLDEEIVSLNAVKSALPAYMEWRNIRQMHQPVAIGTAKEAHVDDKGLYLTSRIVDKNAVMLVDEGVLKGYSIGGKKLSKQGNTITAIELVEISLVDRPANPDCRFNVVKGAFSDIIMYGPDEAAAEGGDNWFKKTITTTLDLLTATVADDRRGRDIRKPLTFGKGAALEYLDDPGDAEYVKLCKREFSDKERSEAAEHGEAMPGGGYPIKSEKDLHNAVQAFGRAKNPEATKQHIIRRAKALGATHALPADWEGSTKKESAAVPDVIKLNAGLFGVADPTMVVPVLSDDLRDNVVLALRGTALGKGAKVAADRIEKGCGTLSDMVCAFGCIRDAQRRLLREGAIEKDGDDEALAHRLGAIAQELAAIMADKAEHEGSEARYMTDADDLNFISWNGEVIMALNADTDDLTKRASKVARAGMTKGMHHLRKAGQAHAQGMKFLQKAGACIGKSFQLGDLAKVGELLKNDKALEHLATAHEHFGEAQDHMEMAHAHFGKAAGEDGGAESGEHVMDPGPVFSHTSHVSALSQRTMTEGEVSWYDADKPYPGKAAAATTGAFTQAQVDALTKAARAEGEAAAVKNENENLRKLLSKTPASGARPAVFTVDKTFAAGGQAAEGNDPNTLLLDDVTPQMLNDKPIDAAGRIIANMHANPQVFGKSLLDPSFRGAAGSGKRN